ncbi:hypothetical protein TNCV_4654731 [Trichonephila clavipes]|nr:hypothetical protein TNCV_4654731 [Trichonephila clavipes]
MLNEVKSADEVKSASQAELKDMVKNGFQKCFDDLYKPLQNSSSCASASSSNARELDEQILEVKINPQEKNTVSDTSTNKDTLSKEKESENENEEIKLIRNDFARYVGTPIDADLRGKILKLGSFQPEGNFQKDAKGRSFSSSYYSFISKAGQNDRKEMAVLFNTTSCCLLSGICWLFADRTNMYFKEA